MASNIVQTPLEFVVDFNTWITPPYPNPKAPAQIYVRINLKYDPQKIQSPGITFVLGAMSGFIYGCGGRLNVGDYFPVNTRAYTGVLLVTKVDPLLRQAASVVSMGAFTTEDPLGYRIDVGEGPRGSPPPREPECDTPTIV